MGFTMPLFHAKTTQCSLTILDNLHLHSEALYSVIMAAQVYLDKVHEFDQQISDSGSILDENQKNCLMIGNVVLTQRVK